MSTTFTITITNPSATGNGAGFIDPQKLEAYFAGQAAVTGVTYQQAQNKKRGNLRHKQVIQMLETMSFMAVDMDVTGGSATTEPTQVAYTVTVSDESALKFSTYTGANALKQAVVAALSADQTHRCDVYSPAPVFNVIDDLVVGALGNASTVAAAVSVA